MSLQDSIATQIAVIDARLAKMSATSMGSDGTSVTFPDYIALSNLRLKLELILNRINGTAPMLARGVVKGFR